MQGNTVTIVKNGKLVNADEDHLRMGDVVVLQAGDVVPADLKLVEARGLEVDEFDIAGTLMPVTKKVGEEDAVLYMGSTVLRGAAKGTVVVAGGQTEFGKVLEEEREGFKPLALQIFQAKYMGLVIALLPALIIHLARTDLDAVGIALFGVGSLLLILLQNDALFQSVLIAAELRSAAHRSIKFRGVNGLAGLANVDLVCFDKTGVLTTRRMEVQTFYFPDKDLNAEDDSSDGLGASISRIVNLACALCNDVLFYEKRHQANAVDRGLMSYAVKHGADLAALLLQYKRVYDVPFDSERRYMACGFRRDSKEVYFLKGDPDVVLDMSRNYVTSAGVQKRIDSGFRRWIASNLDAISRHGDSAIALAYTTETATGTPAGYVFLCLVRLENPLHPGVRETVRGITKHSIRSILLTGDKVSTAIQVGTACGFAIESRTCLSGKAIDRMEAAEITRQFAYCSMFARLVPSQKAYLIRLLQRQGHRVAMIGDGTNDGLALKAADVGISFIDSSSPIARRLATILVSDLKDVLRLIEGAHKTARQARLLVWIRLVVVVGLFLGAYAWTLASQ